MGAARQLFEDRFSATWTDQGDDLPSAEAELPVHPHTHSTDSVRWT